MIQNLIQCSKQLLFTLLHSVFIRRSDKTIDFGKGATRARFVAQKLPLGNLFGPFDEPLNCSAKYSQLIESNLYSYTE